MSTDGSWLSLGWGCPAQPARAIGLQQAAEIKQFHLPTPSIGCLHSQLTSVRGKAQAHGIATRRKAERMSAAIESVFNQNKPSVAALNDHGQIATVPAQGRRAVGLMPVQMAQRKPVAATTEILQLHGGSAALINDQGQLAAITAECRFLLLIL